MADIIVNSPQTSTTVTDIQGSIIVDPNLPSNISPLDIDVLKQPVKLPVIDYTNLDFSSIKLQLLNLLKANSQNFGYSVRDFSDTNTAGMFLNIMAMTGQMMSYHVDSMVNELFLDTAQASWSVNRILGMHGYKSSRPQPGLILLAVTRTPSTKINTDLRTLEDSSEISFSSSLNRKKMTLGGQVFEIFPSKEENGTLIPDLLGDFTIPAYNFYGDGTDPDFNFIEAQKNTYFCFGLTGSTKTEDFVSNGSANQTIPLGNAPVNSSKIIVQVENTGATKIPGKTIYNTWDELTYLSLAGFRNAIEVKTANDGKLPYLISSFKLSSEAFAQKQNGTLKIGSVLELDYDNVLSIAKYQDFDGLLVPYSTCILTSLTSSTYTDSQYVDVLMYHPAYAYCQKPEESAIAGAIPELTNFVYSTDGSQVFWEPGDILYLLEYKTLASGHVSPQIVSDTQIAMASTEYTDIQFLKINPDKRIAIGKAISANTLAFGISSDVDSYIESDSIYEVVWDGDFNASIKFGDGIFGKIPPLNSAIKVIYRIEDTGTASQSVVKAGEANQTVTVGNVTLVLRNDYASAPAIPGESIDISKQLATRFMASQDRAVNGSDYTLIARKYNPDYKIATALSKADADGSIVRLYTLTKRQLSSGIETLEPLSLIEKVNLQTYLNSYKCLGVSIEIADGIIRPLDLRIDVRVKAGYIAGQVKSDISSVVTSYFAVKNTEMGIGFSAIGLVKALGSVAGIDTMDIYFGGLTQVELSTGEVLTSGLTSYQQIKDIPGYTENLDDFPNVVNDAQVVSTTAQQMQPYEILSLNSLIINSVSK